MADQKSIKNKQYILMGVGLVVVIIAIIFGTAKVLNKEEATNAGSVVSPQTGESKKSEGPTDAYRKLVAEHNAAELKAAKKKGVTSIPLLMPSQAEPQNAIQGSAVTSNEMTHNNVQAAAAQPNPVDQAKIEAMREKVNGLLQRPLPGRMLVSQQESAQSTAQTPQAQQAPESSQPAEPRQQVAQETTGRAGETLFATIDSYIHTDEPDTVKLTVQHGPLKGGKVMATATRQNETIKVVTNTLFFNKKTYDMVGQVVDIKTGRGLLSGDVDRKYFERYGIPFLTGAITGAGAAVSQGGTQINSTAGGTVASTSALTGRQIAGATFASGFQGINQQIQNSARNTEPSVTTPANMVVGIFLLSDVTLHAGSDTKAGVLLESSQQQSASQPKISAQATPANTTYQYPLTQTNLFPSQRTNVGVFNP